MRRRSADGLTASQQLELIGGNVSRLTHEADDVFLDEVIPALAEAGVRFCSWNQLDAADQRHMRAMFDQRIFPVLTPLAVDPAHPFPYISDLSLNLAVIVTDPSDGERRFARVKVPPLLPRFVAMPDGERFVPIEQVIAAHLGHLFPGMTVEDHVAFRVTRNADIDLEEEEADDLLEAIELEIRRRRFGRAVRLEVEAGMSEEVLGLLQRELDLSDADTYVHHGPIDLSGLWSVYAIDRPELKYPEFAPVTQRRLVELDGEASDIFSVLRRGDVLVHHPYDSFATSVEEFIRQAATRSGRAVDQADALPHLGRQRHRRIAHPRRRGGQAGGGARRAQGALRRAEQHRLGPTPRARRRARRVRPRRPEDPLQGRARRPFARTTRSSATATSAPATTTRRRPASTRTSVCSPPIPPSDPTPASSSTT